MFLFLLGGAAVLSTLYVVKLIVWQRGLSNIPHKPAAFVLGHLGYLKDADGKGHIHKLFHEMSKEYGAIQSWWTPFARGINVSDPALIKQILTQPENYHSSRNFAVAFRPLSDGLLILDGPVWKRHRKLVTPAFHPQQLRREVSVVHRHTLSLISQWEQSLARVDTLKDFSQLTMNVICECAFGMLPKNAELYSTISEATVQVQERITIPEALWKVMFRHSESKFRQNIQTLKSFVQTVIQEREEKETGEKTLLDMLMTKTEDGDVLTTDELVDETLMFFLAGHETTSNTLAWIFLQLAQNPDYQESLATELVSLLGSDLSTEISYETLSQLKPIDNLIKETLRLFPVAPITGRSAVRDVKIAGYDIPEDTHIIIDFLTPHRDPSFWGSDVLSFRPSRFNEDRLTANPIPPAQFAPFGVGRKSCVGQNFAMVELRVSLSLLLRRFRVSLVPNHPPIDDECNITLKPAPGVFLSLSPRH